MRAAMRYATASGVYPAHGLCMNRYRLPIPDHRGMRESSSELACDSREKSRQRLRCCSDCRARCAPITNRVPWHSLQPSGTQA